MKPVHPRLEIPAAKTVKLPRCAGAVLLVTGLGLASLVPGGPIETRDFSHIAMPVLLAFNIFLTGLGLASIWYGARAAFGKLVSASIALYAGLGFLAVYGLDLLELFPKTHSPMPFALIVIEWLGVFAGFFLIFIGRNVLSNRGKMKNTARWRSMPSLVAIGSFFGLVIIIFATVSAAGG